MNSQSKRQNNQKGKKGKKKSNDGIVRKLERAAGFSKTRQNLFAGVDMMPRFLKSPQGPYPGAQLTVRQLAHGFGTSSGISNSGYGASMGAGQLILNSPTTLYFAAGFNLADLPQATTYTALFDQYRIEKVKLHFLPRSNAISVFNTASPNAAVPVGYLIVDRDDASAPVSVSEVQQFDNAIAFTGRHYACAELVPSITPASYASGAFSGYLVKDSDSSWIDAANTTVTSYGVKGCISGLTTSTTSSWVWDIIAEYIVSFRKVR